MAKFVRMAQSNLLLVTIVLLLGTQEVLAHSNAPDCSVNSDCDDYIDACCGNAVPTTRGRGESHHICWSKYSTRYLDEDGLYYTFECMEQESSEKAVVELETIDLPMSWYVDTLWA